jgi:phosphocarrier protein HPr
MKQYTVTVKWRAGLHARPAGDIVKVANKFKSKITIKKENIEVDGKSIFGIMMLGATYKTNLIIITEGDDEDAAVSAITELFEKNIHE